ncbi:phosphotransferase family protein [Actinokineospora spheciospongiae]|uniref:phosphotransferase family protein n=1 Tax=Actinokineospora spheciospongiae TaxID=909613 RepID=UPI000D70CC63|nr:aminoglycoside phosphotransferase family protein [Actinokineospora spheciospongiae]PWW60357.1 scyllo-inosamine 4-kinase [Actinokineospora spheciospongiae]
MRSQDTRAEALAQAAAEVFAGFGVDFGRARRAGGRTNVTWIGGGLAVRFAGGAGTSNLEQETLLAAVLPPEVGYPRVIGSGVTRGVPWVAAVEVPAVNLDDAWPDLGPDQRARATRQLWAKARAVHGVAPGLVSPLLTGRNPFYACDLAEAVAGPSRLYRAGVLSRLERDRLWELLERHWEVLPGAAVVLNHGDLSPVNALWDGTGVVSLLDFEFAVLAPVHLDLNELVKHAFAPVAPGAGVDDGTRSLVRVEVTAAARSLLRGQVDVDLLLGHSIQLEVWGLERELAKPHRGDFTAWEPYLMLAECARVEGGCYAPLLQEVL